jgi:hypothetical protein
MVTLLRQGKSVLVLNKLSTKPWRRIGSGDIAPPFLTSALDGGEWSSSRPCRFTPREKSSVARCAPKPVWTLWRREGSYELGTQDGSRQTTSEGMIESPVLQCLVRTSILICINITNFEYLVLKWITNCFLAEGIFDEVCFLQPKRRNCTQVVFSIYDTTNFPLKFQRALYQYHYKLSEVFLFIFHTDNVTDIHGTWEIMRWELREAALSENYCCRTYILHNLCTLPTPLTYVNTMYLCKSPKTNVGMLFLSDGYRKIIASQ